MRALTVLALTTMLGGCATPGREGRLALLEVSETEGCTVTAERRRFVLPDDAAPLTAELVRLATRHAGAIVAAGRPEPSFRCRTAFMLALREAGFRRIGFLDDFEAVRAPAD